MSASGSEHTAPDDASCVAGAGQPAPSSSRRAHEIRSGVIDSLGVGLGIFPLGIALGVLVVQAGLPWWIAPALSIGIFAGSVELLLVGLLAAATPILSIAITVFAVNFRHVFYALSFPIARVRAGAPRAYSVYALIDEAYATYVLMPAERLSSSRIVAGQLSMQAYWVLGGLVGVGIAGLLPAPIEGFEFALVALFVVMTLDAARSRRELPSVLLAGLSVGIALLLFPGSALLPALVLYALLLVARYVWSRRVMLRTQRSERTQRSATGEADRDAS